MVLKNTVGSPLVTITRSSSAVWSFTTSGDGMGDGVITTRDFDWCHSVSIGPVVKLPQCLPPYGNMPTVELHWSGSEVILTPTVHRPTWAIVYGALIFLPDVPSKASDCPTTGGPMMPHIAVIDGTWRCPPLDRAPGSTTWAIPSPGIRLTSGPAKP